MTQGKFGLNLAAVAILAFVLAFFGFLEALVLFLAYALLIEKDQWLTRQVFQAFYLRLAYSVAITVIGWFFTALTSFFGLFNAFNAINVFNSIKNVINFLLYVGLFVFGLMAVLRLIKGQDDGLPILGGLADKTMGVFKARAAQPQAAYPAGYTAAAQPQTPPPAQTPAAPAWQAKPDNTAAYQPPAAPVAPAAPAAPEVTAAPAAAPAAVAEAEPEAVAGPESAAQPAAPAIRADGSWTCSCGKDNTGNFCVSCGSRRP